MKDMEKLYRLLADETGADHILRDEPMKAHTTFRIGGPADLFVMPGSEREIADVIRVCRENGVPHAIIGNGSNLLVGDGGYRGVIIQIGKNFSQILAGASLLAMEDEMPALKGCDTKHCLYAQAGAMLTAVARRAWQEGMAGLAFASGIPGTLGGAVMMNAGAYGGEMKQVVRMVRVLTKEGTLLDIPGDEMAFGYRTSVVEKEGYVVLGALLSLQPGDPDEIMQQMEELRIRRTTKQPLDKPSAGSTFKRPEGYFAGKLIMDAGLRGFQMGGAQVSEKHCGFVINCKDATAADVTALMEHVQRTVFEQFGVHLEPEVKRLGEF